MVQVKLVAASIATAFALQAGAAHAQSAASTQSVPQPAASHDQDAFVEAAVTDDVLGKVAGREDTAKLIANANQQNTVANNSVTGNSVTGNVAIDGNAFQNLQGMAVISANSGNNVAINSAMNVTINLVH